MNNCTTGNSTTGEEIEVEYSYPVMKNEFKKEMNRLIDTINDHEKRIKKLEEAVKALEGGEL